jgi:putative hydrolase of the HAD superfamily
MQHPPQRPLRTRSGRHYPQTTAPHTVWLFDLDNTLHNASHGIFQAIDRSMTEAVAEFVRVDMDEANALRQKYWKRYGATMIGLHRHHGVDAQAFLHRSHNFDLQPLLSAEDDIIHQLNRLPGRKIVLTNAPEHYARDVLQLLGMQSLFDEIWAIEHMQLQGRFRPKPSLALMQQLQARFAVPAEQFVLVEDTLRNLKSAKQLGMQTVHIFNPGTPHSALHRGRNSYVDLRIHSIRDLAQRHRKLKLVEYSSR